MKKIISFALVAICAISAIAQTVSTSKVTFMYCYATTGSDSKWITAEKTFPFEWNGTTWTEPGTQIVTTTNARGCDSLLSLTVKKVHYFSVDNVYNSVYKW